MKRDMREVMMRMVNGMTSVRRERTEMRIETKEWRKRENNEEEKKIDF